MWRSMWHQQKYYAKRKQNSIFHYARAFGIYNLNCIRYDVFFVESLNRTPNCNFDDLFVPNLSLNRTYIYLYNFCAQHYVDGWVYLKLKRTFIARYLLVGIKWH